MNSLHFYHCDFSLLNKEEMRSFDNRLKMLIECLSLLNKLPDAVGVSYLNCMFILIINLLAAAVYKKC